MMSFDRVTSPRRGKPVRPKIASEVAGDEADRRPELASGGTGVERHVPLFQSP